MKWPLSEWFASRAKAKASPPSKRRRLKLETLEDRCVPATLHVMDMVSDSATVGATLRHEIALAAAGDTIVIDVAGTLTLTNGALKPTVALTINGLGPTKDIIKAGAGINNIFFDKSAALTLSGLTLTGAHAASYGGAIYSTGGLLTIANCTISGNTATGGGGIYAKSGLTLESSTVSGNTATTGNGGGVYARGTTKIVNTTISGNNGGTSNGAGLFFEGGGALTICRTTISGNTGGSGAGIYAADLSSTATIVNSTISGNTATGTGGGIYVHGNGTMTLVNDTIALNTSQGGNGGGGLSLTPNVGTLSVNVLNTIVANNTAPPNKAPDIAGKVTATHSLIRSTMGTTFTGSTATDIFGVDPHLGPLQNNGGPTMTMALLAGSLAIDAGDDSVTGGPYSLTTDQRGPGFARKVGVHVDIGAFEYVPPPKRRGRGF